MKKTILAITAVMLILSIMISAYPTTHTQPINTLHETPDISDQNQQATSVETIENGEKPQDGEETNTSHNQDCHLDDTEETERTQSVTSNNPPESPANTSQDENASTDTPPDGRIYWSPEPPYAYIPTQTPKGSENLPIMPPELDN